jgi:hypothetical protein
MSSEFLLQTPPRSAREGDEAAVVLIPQQSPPLRIMIRHGHLAVLASYLDVRSLLRLMSSQKIMPLDWKTALKAILKCMVALIPEISLKEWKRVMKDVERPEVVRTINKVYVSFVHDRGFGLSRNLDHQSSYEFVHEWLDEADPRTFGDMLMSGYFASRAKRAGLARSLEEKLAELQDRLTNPLYMSNQVQQYREFLERKVVAYHILIDITKKSFALEFMTVNGRAWGNTGMKTVKETYEVENHLYVSVSRSYVEELNERHAGDELFRPFLCDQVSDRIWEDTEREDTERSPVPFPSPPLTFHDWNAT